jgi:hypothetical protein
LATALQYPRERVAAATVLLDRGWGRPLQTVAGPEGGALSVEFKWADATPAEAPQVTAPSDAAPVAAVVAAAVFEGAEVTADDDGPVVTFRPI